MLRQILAQPASEGTRLSLGYLSSYFFVLYSTLNASLFSVASISNCSLSKYQY